MPEVFKKSNGDINWTTMIASFGAVAVLIIQQFQSYRIAEIQAQGKVNAVQFMKKDEVVKRLNHMDDVFMKKDELLHHLNKLERSHGLHNEDK